MNGKSPSNSPWSDEEVVEKLKELWAQGFSCSLIAKKMGPRFSRNAIISKLHRLGMTSQENGSTAKRKTKNADLGGWQQLAIKSSTANKRPIPKQISRTPTKPDTELALKRDPDAPLHQRKTILVRQDGKVFANDNLTAQCCRWGIGDPSEKDFHFCGAPTVPGLAYCEPHAKRAYQKNPITVAQRMRPSRVPTFRDYLEEELL